MQAAMASPLDSRRFIRSEPVIMRIGEPEAIPQRTRFHSGL